jgi:predicted polyphosphate/ATP-dependent NAD kinase
VPSLVGLIVNPAAGRDIRRLVGLASVIPHHEKAAIVRRVLRGLEAAEVDTVLYLPDGVGIVAAALDGMRRTVRLEPLPVLPRACAADSTEAARLLSARGVGAVVTIGGDGTNRAVAAGCSDIPLVAISTGTNNVFPTMVEGTVAGLAAGLVATGAVAAGAVSRRSKRVAVRTSAVDDFALVDAAACRDAFRGAAAVWDVARVRALVLARAEPWAVGLSSIGGRIHPVAAEDPGGLYLELGGRSGRAVHAVLAPGLTADVVVSEYRLLHHGEEVTLDASGGTIALDGERELLVDGPATASVTRSGPLVIDVRRALTAASAHD